MNIKLFTTFSGYESQYIAFNEFSKSINNQISATLVGWCDIDYYEGSINRVVSSHNANFPESYGDYFNDIQTVDWKAAPDFDMLFCSSPCQDLSGIGKGKGLDPETGSRSSLLFEVEKAIDEKHPNYIICENVKGEVFDGPIRKNLPFFIEFNHSLALKGYTCYWKVLHGSDYGVPQNRPRTFLVAIKNEIDEKKPFQWPKHLPMSNPLGYFDKFVDNKYYLSHNSILTFMNYLTCGKSKRRSTMVQCGKDVTAENGDKIVSRTVTALCEDGSIPTLLANGFGGTEKMLANQGMGKCSGLFEVWEHTHNNSKEEMKLNQQLQELARRYKNKNIKPWVKEILDSILTLKPNQYVRVRKMTPTEAFRFMGVPQEYIQRMTQPRVELKKLGYSKEQIDKLLTVHGKVMKVNDKKLYHQAGNSIVVDVIKHIYASLLLSREEYENWYEKQLKENN